MIVAVAAAVLRRNNGDQRRDVAVCDDIQCIVYNGSLRHYLTVFNYLNIILVYKHYLVTM